MRRQTLLATLPGLDLRLTWYRPGEAMSAHVHAEHQISWLLAGELRETSAGRELDVLRVSRGVKPAGLPHANVYGGNGALILGLNLTPDSPLCASLDGLDDWRWTAGGRERPGEILRLARALADGSVPTDAVLTDLAAGAGASPACLAPTGRGVAHWLTRVREQLRDDPDEPDMARLAAEAGVHRVHLSRSFSRHFGLAPSLYRLRCRVGRGIADLASGASLAEAAAMAGFADQSHFTRAARRETGLTPRHLRALVAA